MVESGRSEEDEDLAERDGELSSEANNEPLVEAV